MSSVSQFIGKFNKMGKQTEESLKKNPYSDTYEQPAYQKEAKDYARPPPGSKTEARGIRAGNHVVQEIIFLCELINENAKGEPPNRVMKFGPLFYLYSHYSEKLVGMLIRARKYGLVDFEGEMLYQRQDDHKDIRLLYSIEEIRRIVRYSGDPVKCVAIVK